MDLFNQTRTRVTVQRDQPRVRINYPPVAIVMGLAFSAFGVLMAILAWRSAHGGPPRPVAALALFGLCAILFGLLLTGYAVRGLQQRRRFRNAGGHAPWRFDYRWDPRGSDDDGSRSVLRNAVAVLGISFFLVPFHLILRETPPEARSFFFLVLGIFDLVIFLALCRTVYLLLRRMLFGRTRVLFRQFPYYTGQKIELEFIGGPRLSSRKGLKAVLHCIKEYYEWSGSGSNRTSTPVMESVWRSECPFDTDGSGRGELGFAAPDDVPGTDLIGDAKTRPPYYWELEVHSDRPGIDYEGIFLIPVYRAGEPVAVPGDQGDQAAVAAPVAPARSRASIIFTCLFFSVFLLLGGLVVTQTTKRVIRNYGLVRHGSKAVGMVADYKQSSHSIWPVVTFTTADGRSITFESLYHPDYSGYAKGQQVPVVYDPAMPGKTEIDQPERLWGGLGLSYGLGGVFMTIGGGAIIVLLRRKGRL